MTRVLKAIERVCEPTRILAEDCEFQTNQSWTDGNLSGNDAIEELRWVHCVCIVEAILLQAFKETERTSGVSNYRLIQIASELVRNNSFVKEILEYEVSRRQIEVQEQPFFEDVKEMLQSTFAEVVDVLMGG